MKIFLIDQYKKFNLHLEYLKNKPLMKYDKTRLIEKVTTIDIQTKKTIEELDLEFLFNYSIFPNKIMTFLTQWKEEKRKMKVGDTIVQQVYLPPIKSISQKIIFGVRINEIIDKDYKKGFSYETIEGHVEKGISIFTVEELKNKVIFKIQTFSTHGNLLTKIIGPIFSIPYQTYCTKSALNNVKHQIEKQ